MKEEYLKDKDGNIINCFWYSCLEPAIKCLEGTRYPYCEKHLKMLEKESKEYHKILEMYHLEETN